jgi:hypothetical protein
MFFIFSSKRRHRLAQATRRLTVAETELTAALAELTRSDRADKQIVGERLRAALAELVAARGRLVAFAAPAL